MSRLPKKYLIFPVILLLIYFIVRIVDQSKILFFFPLDYTNDISSYMAMLHFLKDYGYHGFVLNWFNGFTLFDVYAPGWFFFAYPIYYLSDDIQATVYISMLIMFALFAVLVYFLGKMEKWKSWHSFAFFILFVGSPFVVGDFIRQMRLPQMFGWISFILLIIIALHYRGRKIDAWFLWTIPVFALMIISHSAEVILFSLVVAGLLITRKSISEAAVVVLSMIAGIIVSMPWLYTFLTKSPSLVVSQLNFSWWLLDFTGSFKFANITSIALSVMLFVVYALYSYSRKLKLRDHLFFAPILLFNLLFTFRVTPFLPLFSNLYLDPIVMFVYFFLLYFLFNINYETLGGTYKRLLKVGLTLLPVLFILVSVYHTPFFVTPSDKELYELSIVKDIEGNFITTWSDSPRFYSAAIVSYAPIFYNSTSATGWAYLHATPEYWNLLKNMQQQFDARDCHGFKASLEMLNVEEVFSYGKANCEITSYCGLELKVQKGDACLYRV